MGEEPAFARGTHALKSTIILGYRSVVVVEGAGGGGGVVSQWREGDGTPPPPLV